MPRPSTRTSSAYRRTPPTPKPGKSVRAIPERLISPPWLEVTFPRVVGYRFDVPAERLSAKFDSTHREVLTTQEIPTLTISSTIVGSDVRFTLEEAKALRPQTVSFHLATHRQQDHLAIGPGCSRNCLASFVIGSATHMGKRAPRPRAARNRPS
jgi:type III restriction enzyme